jgi:hypothetical protein
MVGSQLHRIVVTHLGRESLRSAVASEEQLNTQ